MTAGISTVSAAFPDAGLESARPTSGVPIPAFYSATDTGVVYRSDDAGATWAIWALALPEGTTDGDVPVWDATAGLWVPGAGGGSGSYDEGTWAAPTLAGSWVNFGSGFQDARYRKSSTGVVRLDGVITGGTGTMFTLPVGFRPAADAIFVVSANSLFGEIRVYTTGVVARQVGAAAWYSLCGVTFAVA